MRPIIRGARVWAPVIAVLAMAACTDGPGRVVEPVSDPLVPNVLSMSDNPPLGYWGAHVPVDLSGLLARTGPMLGASTSGGGLLPTAFAATLAPGESASEDKVLTLTGTPPAVDVLFSFDMTGSMGGAINQVRTNSVTIMNNLAGLIGDVRFGLISYEDYPASYGPAADNCGYESTYGYESAGDMPYRLNRSLTTDFTSVATEISAVPLAFGGDGPEAYSRALYESYAELIDDENPTYGPIGWRPGARKFVINFADNIPHDCDVWAPIGLPGTSTGRDPGRDAEINTADDLEIIPVIEGMRDANVTLINFVNSSNANLNALWSHYATTTGGSSFETAANGDLPSGLSLSGILAGLIQNASSVIRLATLQVCPADAGTFGSWLTSVSPASYTDVDLTSGSEDLNFVVEYAVPAATSPGVYTFAVCGIGDGAEYGRQSVTITVPDAAGDPPEATEACSPGFWGQNGVHTESWPASYADGTSLGDVFSAATGANAAYTMRQAVQNFPGVRGGGNTLAGAERTLLRHAAAAVLNAASFGSLYPMTEAGVKATVNAALTSGDRATMLSLAALLDAHNNNLMVDAEGNLVLDDEGEPISLGSCPLPR